WTLSRALHLAGSARRAPLSLARGAHAGLSLDLSTFRFALPLRGSPRVRTRWICAPVGRSLELPEAPARDRAGALSRVPGPPAIRVGGDARGPRDHSRGRSDPRSPPSRPIPNRMARAAHRRARGRR